MKKLLIAKLLLIVLLSFAFCTAAFALDKAHWMHDLYGEKGDTRLVDIPIPGTHNSATHKIHHFSKVVPSAPCVFGLTAPIVASWSKTQFRSVYEQLMSGIRFLDIRIAYDKHNVPWAAHGLMSLPFEKVLNEITQFITQNPREVVLVSYELEYYFRLNLPQDKQTQLREDLDHRVKTAFGDRLRQEFSHEISLNDFWMNQKSIMVMNDYQNLWADEYRLDQLKQKLDDSLRTKSPEKFSVLALFLTAPPDIHLLINPGYCFSCRTEHNLLSGFNREVRSQGISWIKEWKASPNPFNIITTDFFDQFDFVESVLGI